MVTPDSNKGIFVPEPAISVTEALKAIVADKVVFEAKQT